MNTMSVSEMRRIQFVAANFSKLQGLRSVPLGIGLLLMAFWANQQHGPAREALFFLAPSLILLFCGGAYWLVDRYYDRTFGRVRETAVNRRVDWLLGVLAGAAGLAAFWVDTALRPAVSAVGLVLAAALLCDYFRLVIFSRTWCAPFTPIYALLLALVSILPTVGWDQWWRWMGVKAELLAISMSAGAIITLGGLVSHLYFIHSFSAEARDGRSL